MSPVRRPSTVDGLRRGLRPADQAPEPAGIPRPATPRPEKPVRMTLDLAADSHRVLRSFVVDCGAGITASAVLRALLAELHDDPALAARIRARMTER